MKKLHVIKKRYGEEMMHFCRANFATILEQEGLLLALLGRHFYPNHQLIYDIKKEKKENCFRRYIYGKAYLPDVEKQRTNHLVPRHPKELLKEAGYQFYECHTEAEIQSFKKYFAEGEELCTFRGYRLNTRDVFFAVKDNVDQIKREDFLNPMRQDLYGTSVISIQFNKDESHTLSITNRYNHIVDNADATFSNNLDNIIEGLTDAFEYHYRLKQKRRSHSFDLSQYVNIKGRYYKYNQIINDVYYCFDHVIIDQKNIKQFDKERYLIIHDCVLDLSDKTFYLYDDRNETKGGFHSSIWDIEKIEIAHDKKEKKKRIFFNTKEGNAEIVLNEQGGIVEYQNDFVTEIGDFFLSGEPIEKLVLPNVKKEGSVKQKIKCKEVI